MYKLGVIGGMGPLATVNFYEKLIRMNKLAKQDSDHIDMVILNHATLPDRTTCILNQQDNVFLDSIKSDFELLNTVGVNAIAIPCNTSHYFYDDYMKMTDIPIINMVEETVLKLKQLGYKKAVVFATKGTIYSGVYKKYCQKHQIDVIDMLDEDVDSVMDIIYDIKSTGNLNEEAFNRLIHKYCNDLTVGIIACTELSLIPITKAFNVLDALNVLVEVSLDKVMTK